MRSLHRPTWPRAAAWALLALLVLSGHGLLLLSLWPAAGLPGLQVEHRPVPTLSVRTLILSQPELPQPTPAPAPAHAVPRRTTPAAVNAAAAPLPQPVPAAENRPQPGSTELPVYATQLPDPVELHYRLQRGGKVGAGRLQWQRDQAGYALRLEVEWPGQPTQGSASRGLIDADGLAPLRHAELRRARELRAVNFQREVARITFSGPQVAYALPPGAQDRLSWMIQLPAIIEADATLTRAGTVLTLFVAGTRGDAEAWHFEVLGHVALELAAGAVPLALHLKREPTRPYDSQVEVWLDPARQHLPVRALFTALPGGEPLQLELAGPDAGLEIGASGPR